MGKTTTNSRRAQKSALASVSETINKEHFLDSNNYIQEGYTLG
ncbi:MAG: hypothetical protein ACM3O3_01585 [Syntrophothermus sp.]